MAAIGLGGWHIASVHVNPMLGPLQQQLVRVGALDAGQIVQHHQYWRLLSNPFTNAGALIFWSVSFTQSLECAGRGFSRAAPSILAPPQ